MVEWLIVTFVVFITANICLISKDLVEIKQEVVNTIITFAYIIIINPTLAIG